MRTENHIYVEIKRNQKIVALLKYIIKHNQKMIRYKIKPIGTSLPKKRNSQVN